MEKDNSSNLLRDLSTVTATLLPIIQLFFTNLPKGIKEIYQEPEYFTGVSIVTLIVSYVLIVAYQISPWFSFTIPFQGKRPIKYQDYIRKTNEASASYRFTAGEQASVAKIDNYLKKLNIKPVKPPLKFSYSNLSFLCVFLILSNTISFVVIGQITNPDPWLTIVQSLNYIVIISFTALLLTVYYKLTQNSKEWEADQINRTKRAINLAIFANGFDPIPAPKFMSAYEDSNFPSNYHVFVEYKDDQYEVITDPKGAKLIAVIKIQR